MSDDNLQGSEEEERLRKICAAFCRRRARSPGEAGGEDIGGEAGCGEACRSRPPPRSLRVRLLAAAVAAAALSFRKTSGRGGAGAFRARRCRRFPRRWPGVCDWQWRNWPRRRRRISRPGTGGPWRKAGRLLCRLRLSPTGVADNQCEPGLPRGSRLDESSAFAGSDSTLPAVARLPEAVRPSDLFSVLGRRPTESSRLRPAIERSGVLPGVVSKRGN